MGDACCGSGQCHDDDAGMDELMQSFGEILGTIDAIVNDEKLSDAEKITELKGFLEELQAEEDEDDEEENDENEEK